MNITLLVIAVSILVLVTILFGLFVLISFKRIQTTKRQQKIENTIESRQSDWIAYLIEGSLEAEALAPSGKIEIEAADEVLYRVHKNFHSKQIHFRINHYIELYLQTYYHDLLSSNKWSERVNVLQRISLFRLQFMASTIQELADDDSSYSKEETMLIYKIISMVNPTKFMPYFTNPEIMLGEFDYRRLLMQLEKEQLKLLFRQFDELPVSMQHVLVDVIGSKFLIDFLPLLEECLSSADTELRIRSLKAISSIDSFPESDCAAPFVHSEIWEERLMAAKLYANAPLEQARETLSNLLKDSVYQVRKQAAVSLQAIRTGDETLQAFIRQSDDSYAIAMAAEMIGKELDS